MRIGSRIVQGVPGIPTIIIDKQVDRQYDIGMARLAGDRLPALRRAESPVGNHGINYCVPRIPRGVVKKGITAISLLLAASSLYGISCTSTQPDSLLKPPEVLLELSSFHFQLGIKCFEKEDYCQAIKNFKLACNLNPASTEASKWLEDAKNSFHRQEKKRLDESVGIAAKIAIIDWAYDREQRELCEIDYEVGNRLMGLGLYQRAKEVFSEGLDRVKWYPYLFDYDGHYERLFKSAVEDVNASVRRQQK